MNVLGLFFICGMLAAGCNYSSSKSPLIFQQAGTRAFETLPPGTLVSYSVINTLIMQTKCLECHSSAVGDDGGINLETYENVTENLEIIKSEIASDNMPKNRTKLTANQKDILFTWIKAGGPLNVPTTPSDMEFISYEMVHTKVLQPRCLGCHSESGGNRGDVNLENFESVAALASTIEEEIKSGSMPRPKNEPLTPEQKELILKWITNGAPKSLTQ